jgi:hypothetical protein
MQADSLLHHLRLPRLSNLEPYYHPEDESNLPSDLDEEPGGALTTTEGSP